MPEAPRGRGTGLNPANRFEEIEYEWEESADPADKPAPKTRFFRDNTKSILVKNDSPDISFTWSLNPYRGCEHGCVYCLAGDTAILMANGSTRELASLSVGDEVIGTVKSGHYRRYAKTKVLAHWSTTKPAYRVILEDGTELIASADHRFLTERGWKHVAQHGSERRPHLTVNNKLMGFGKVLTARKRDIAGQAVKSSARLGVAVIEPLGRELPLWDISTGTEDFVANGVISHNCYARPYHEYLGLSSGLDFETMIFVKEDAPKLLAAELAKPSWEPETIALGGVTDVYQPIERKLQVTRRCLQVLADARNPCGLVTKNALVTRDIDVFQELSRHAGARVMLSLTTLDPELARRMEPRASAPSARLGAMRELAKAGVPVGVMTAPMILGLNDHEMPRLLEAAADAGATTAGYVPLRLPHQLGPLFDDWLAHNYPDRREKVLNQIKAMRGGALNDPRFGSRMRGEGIYAEHLEKLFKLACGKLGLNKGSGEGLTTANFRRPILDGQLRLL